MSSEDAIDEAAEVAAEADLDESGEALAEADKDVTTGQRRYAYGYLTVLFLGIVLAIGGSVYLGILAPEITITATVSIGWIVEYVAMALAAAFVLFTFAMILVALPGSILSAIATLLANTAQGYVRRREERGSDRER